MINQQLLDYIKQQLQQGVSREVVSSNLARQGWQPQDIGEALSQVSGQNTTVQGNLNNFGVGGDPMKNYKSTLGLILGLIGLVAWLLPIAGLPISVIGLVYSIKGLKSAKRGMAIAGIILSVLGLLATLGNAALGVFVGIYGYYPAFLH